MTYLLMFISRVFWAPIWSRPRTSIVTLAAVTVIAMSGCSLLGGFVEPDGIPTNFGVVNVSPSSIEVGWIDNSTNESGFSVERSNDQGITYQEVGTVGADTTRYFDPQLSSETKYYYRVRAYNRTGNSDYATAISVNTLAVNAVEIEPEITIISPLDQAEVQIPFDVEFRITDWGHEDPSGNITHFHPFIGSGESLEDQGAEFNLSVPYTVSDLDPGFYRITLKLANSDHTFIGVNDTIEITVVD